MMRNLFDADRFVLPVIFIWLVLSATIPLRGHPDKVERQLLSHFASGSHQPENGMFEDLTHSLASRIMGAPVWTNLGPAQGILLNGLTDYLVLADSPAAARNVLPTKEFSVTAWALLNETRDDGGIIGLAQDNGDYEKGWFLGYNRRSFTFTLATKGTDDGDGKLTR